MFGPKKNPNDRIAADMARTSILLKKEQIAWYDRNNPGFMSGLCRAALQFYMERGKTYADELRELNITIAEREGAIMRLQKIITEAQSKNGNPPKGL